MAYVNKPTKSKMSIEQFINDCTLTEAQIKSSKQNAIDVVKAAYEANKDLDNEFAEDPDLAWALDTLGTLKFYKKLSKKEVKEILGSLESEYQTRNKFQD